MTQTEQDFKLVNLKKYQASDEWKEIKARIETEIDELARQVLELEVVQFDSEAEPKVAFTTNSYDILQSQLYKQVTDMVTDTTEGGKIVKEAFTQNIEELKKTISMNITSGTNMRSWALYTKADILRLKIKTIRKICGYTEDNGVELQDIIQRFIAAYEKPIQSEDMENSLSEITEIEA